jgi:hypothetical protein
MQCRRYMPARRRRCTRPVVRASGRPVVPQPQTATTDRIRVPSDPPESPIGRDDRTTGRLDDRTDTVKTHIGSPGQQPSLHRSAWVRDLIHQAAGAFVGYRLAYALADLPKPKDLAAVGAHWAPGRSVAAWYLWRFTDAGKAG